MPICEADTWRMQYFEHVPCPADVLISTEDADSWVWYPRWRWIYDKVAVALSQDLDAAPHGVEPKGFPVKSGAAWPAWTTAAGTGIAGPPEGGKAGDEMRAPKGSDEPLILVDESNRAVGAAPKQAIHRQGLLHRAFSIFMVDDRGRILLQQRNPRKYHSGGLWANSCCGHPRPGDRRAVRAHLPSRWRSRTVAAGLATWRARPRRRLVAARRRVPRPTVRRGRSRSRA